MNVIGERGKDTDRQTYEERERERPPASSPSLCKECDDSLVDKQDRMLTIDECADVMLLT